MNFELLGEIYATGLVRGFVFAVMAFAVFFPISFLIARRFDAPINFVIGARRFADFLVLSALVFALAWVIFGGVPILLSNVAVALSCVVFAIVGGLPALVYEVRSNEHGLRALDAALSAASAWVSFAFVSNLLVRATQVFYQSVQP